MHFVEDQGQKSDHIFVITNMHSNVTGPRIFKFLQRTSIQEGKFTAATYVLTFTSQENFVQEVPLMIIDANIRWANTGTNIVTSDTTDDTDNADA